MNTTDPRTAVRRAVQAEISARGWNMADLARTADINPDTVQDFLAGRSWPTSRTRGQIEKALGWPPGAFTAIYDGEEPPPVGGGDKDGDHDDPDVIRYRRPDGLTDDAWNKMREQLEDYIEYQLDKAARER